MKICVGMGSCGIAAGADKIYELLKQKSSDVSIVGCNGMCYLEPIVTAGSRVYTQVSETDIDDIVNSRGGVHVSDESKSGIALRNCGSINPENIDDYIAVGGYKAYEKCKSMTPEKVIDIVKASGLAGRGGAGFPTWFKWDAARNSVGEYKYIICNADEGDPGAFMDRAILEGDPHSVIEGMLIAAYAIAAEVECEGIIYVRAEYPLAIKRLEIALEQAKQRGYLDKMSIRIKQGAGAFVCGEETALIASLEGERGMPRLKPPFPAQKGYWQKPSNINNVETFANVAYIINNSDNPDKAKANTKVFALTGKIANGGLAEVPMGCTVRDVVYDYGGGLVDSKLLKAVQLGGPSGGCIPADLLDTEIDYKALAATGAIMGSGGMVVMDDTSCMVDMARYFLDFTCKESCGKCTHCRIGNKRLLEILERICDGDGKDGDIELLEDLSEEIKAGSLCALGQTAPNPVLTTIKYFRNEYEDHITNKKCTAKSCKEMLTYSINAERCVNCVICRRTCPADAISDDMKTLPVIDMEKCIKCGQCVTACKFKAVDIE